MNGYKVPLAVILFVIGLLATAGGTYIRYVEKGLEDKIEANLDRNTERYGAIMEELKYIRGRLDSQQ